MEDGVRERTRGRGSCGFLRSGEEEMTIRWFSYILVCFLWLGCYDGHRDNPLDPKLTPAVELLDVQVDEGEGTATLMWTEYEGEMGFASYRVERRVAQMVSVDTLEVISSVSDTTWIDERIAPDTEYVYRVIVRNADGFEQESNAYRSGSFSVYPVRLLELEMDAQRGGRSLPGRATRGRGSRSTGSSVSMSGCWRGRGKAPSVRWRIRRIQMGNFFPS